MIPYHQHLGQTGRFGHLLDDLEERFETVVGEDDGREALLLGGHQRQKQRRLRRHLQHAAHAFHVMYIIIDLTPTNYMYMYTSAHHVHVHVQHKKF